MPYISTLQRDSIRFMNVYFGRPFIYKHESGHLYTADGSTQVRFSVTNKGATRILFQSDRTLLTSQDKWRIPVWGFVKTQVANNMFKSIFYKEHSV